MPPGRPWAGGFHPTGLNSMPDQLINAIRRAIAADPRSQNAIARAAGMSRATLSRYLTGRVQPTTPSLDRLAAALGGWRVILIRTRAFVNHPATRPIGREHRRTGVS